MSKPPSAQSHLAEQAVEVVRKQKKSARPKAGASAAEPTPPATAADVDEEGAQTSVSFESLRLSDFTEYAADVIMVARKLGQGRPRPEVCSMRRLLASLLLSGFHAQQDLTGAWLFRKIEKRSRTWIAEQLAKEYPVIAEHRSFVEILRAELPVSGSMTEALQRTLDLARRLAHESRPGRTDVLISARHFLGAAVARSNQRTNVERFLRNVALGTETIRTEILRDLPVWKVDDDRKIWRQILEAPPSTEQENGLPNYAADSATGNDLIGITREVEAMASLVSAWSVEPPLSIGLFGEWGSGKSFFMQKMKERVRHIAAEARASKQGQKTFGYYKNIVQVEFNAWHYVEGNLWASLVEHIFSNLRFEGTAEENLDSEEHIQLRLERLLGKLKEKSGEATQLELEAKEASAEAEKTRRAAEATVAILETAAEEARQRASDAETKGKAAEKAAFDKQMQAAALTEERNDMGLRDVLEEVKQSPEVRQALSEIQGDLAQAGISMERLKTADGLQVALKEASETGSVLMEGLKILWEDKRRWWLLFWVLAVPAAVLALGLAAAWFASQHNAPWLQAVLQSLSVVGTVAGAIVAFWRQVAPKLKPIVEGIKRVKAKRAEIDLRIEEAKRERARKAADLDAEARKKRQEAADHADEARKKLAEAEKERAEAERKQREAERAEKAAQAARAEADKLKEEADALRPDRRIAAFIQDRAGAKDYRQHLGVPALIRRDFEKLAGMFRTQRQQEDESQDAVGENNPAIVNRIILYIDDLDRCPPEKVVDVLRAIHLLLAFPLFVVVVAVDARWMKRSLRDQFALMLKGPALHNGSGNHPPPEEDDLAFGPTATPDDYLEKIFQVPFWIRPLSNSACRNLVSALTKSASHGDPDAAPKGQGGAANAQTAADHSANAVQGKRKRKGGPAPAAEDATGNQRGATPGGSGDGGSDFEWRKVEPNPRVLHLTKDEREYMVKLAAIVGRSPRSVKRFINCYRLLKLALDKGELDAVTSDGTFRTIMFLLGLVTGMPEVAPALLTNLRQTSRATTPMAWARGAAKQPDLGETGRWEDLLPAVDLLRKESRLKTIGPLIDAADLIDRFSFSPVRGKR